MDGPEKRGPSDDATGKAEDPPHSRDGAPADSHGSGQAQENQPDAGVGARPLFGRGVLLALCVWGVMMLGVTGAIAGTTALWPLVPVVGIVLPLGLAFVAAWHHKNQVEALRGREIRSALVSDERAERELLGALLQGDGLTASAAAARTSLAVSQAAGVLERIAGRGHLDVAAVDGDLVYALRDGGPREIAKEGGADGPPQEGERREPAPPVEPPVEPLSEREVEVARLLASGRTNREIAHELYVSHGTVKAHTANIYRKLGAHNRAEMIGKARSLGLLG
jgi:DNA-binding CsgD family transcriptional regulator